ncbi:MAG TPA: DUF5110 domain-containing protein, partial [Candidatus Acidoferrum sp.]|nr:DUF5110 domain-containing protein [Candidatus Acidoferrum sp.]
RAHGTRTTNQNEIWSYGPQMQAILERYDRLRYRLLPYIYSVAWKTTSENYTQMRALAMDFRDDPRVLNIGDQYLFGPSLLVNPVTEPGATTRHLYLPKGNWYNFWTGESVEGGRAIDTPAPLEEMPIFVRAGAILPMGPTIEYAQQPSNDPLEIRVYTGADGDFTFYEDDGDTYDYEKGAFATIPIHWNEATHRLIIGARKGSYAGMPQTLPLVVVFVRKGTGIGFEEAKFAPREVIPYDGRMVEVTLSENLSGSDR